MSRVSSLITCALIITLYSLQVTGARGDSFQNTASDGSAAQLAAAGFGALNGTGINVGVVEAGGFAAAYYGNAAANTIAPNSSLPNGNPDLPGTRIQFVQSGQAGFNLPGGQLPQGNPPAAIGGVYGIDNHASEVSGVIMGQGAADAADRGISPGAKLSFASLNPALNGSPAIDNDAANAIQLVLQTNSTPIVNNSWGFVQKNGAGNQYAPAVNGGNQSLFLSATNTAIPNGSPEASYAHYSDNTRIPLYQLNNTGGNPIATNNIVPTANNGNSTTSKFVDWAAGAYNSLVVVAGNEGLGVTGLNGTQGYFGAAGGTRPTGTALSLQTGAPSDAYNCINVGATGARGYLSGGNFVVDNANGAFLNYGIAANYNTTNITSDTGVTGYGRIKTDIVAPGGDPKSNNYPPGTFAAPPVFNSQFTSTAGGQYSYEFSVNIANPGDPAQFVPFYGNDVFNGANPGLVPANVTTATPFTASNVSQIKPNGGANNFPASNPGGFANADVVDSGSAIAGTSFAAPAVSGAASLVYQYYTTTPANQGWSVDHRLVKAIILNGANHFYNGPNGVQPLMESDNATPWTRLQGGPITATPPQGTSATNFGGSFPKVRPGLDPQLGTGLLDVVQSLKNYSAGRQGPGIVNPTGWDVNSVAQGLAATAIAHAYTFTTSGGLFSATLCWDAVVENVDPSSHEGLSIWSTGSELNRLAFTDLDLYLFAVNGDGSLGQNIDYSTSDIDNVEYLYDTLPAGKYQIDVVNASFAAPLDTTYGLAWTAPVPEPATLCLMALGAAALLAKRRRLA